MQATKNELKIVCYHCGEDCNEQPIYVDKKAFCCSGCRMVYDLLNKSELCTYYELAENPGINQKQLGRSDKFSFLDDAEVQAKLIQFSDAKQTRVSFYIPQMHCSSCIWLLENLHRLNPAITASQVDFPKKEISIVYQNNNCSLRIVAEILSSIGYEPHIHLSDLDEKKVHFLDRARLFKVGIAGFCFGNIMMLSFPEYFSSGLYYQEGMRELFSYLILALSLPVFLYSASEFYISAWKGIKQKHLNIDAPIVLAILITFSRSIYEITTGTGAGYLDSMSGIVFFMLVGRIFQDKVYNSISFERDYKSYFPVSVAVIKDGKEENIPVSKLKIGDRILVRNQELIPADSILFFGKASIDYSFVTGESQPVEKCIGEIVYAGGKQMGTSLEMEVIKEVSQSYLTQLWNNDAFSNSKQNKASFIDQLSKHFTLLLFSIAAITCIYWGIHDSTKIITSLTAILIVACPCSLLLSATFTNGNIIRILSRNHFFVKNSTVIESLATADTIVFDKTGTLTQNEQSSLVYSGKPLSDFEEQLIYSLSAQSSHPMSKAIANHYAYLTLLRCENFKEQVGKGIEASILSYSVKLGSTQFLTESLPNNLRKGNVLAEINGQVKGSFLLKSSYRNGFEALVDRFKKKYSLALISGDTDTDRNYLQRILGESSLLLFKQSPQDKLNFIATIQKKGKKVIMLGDGLNDAGALKKSDVGIALSDKSNTFSPACDALLDAQAFNKLPELIRFAKSGKNIILGSFVISLLYNVVGISFAVQGTLSPMIAAILMPTSSLSILIVTVGLSTLLAKKRGLN